MREKHDSVMLTLLLIIVPILRFGGSDNASRACRAPPRTRRASSSDRGA